MRELMELRFPLGNDLMTTVRLATGGMCSLTGLDLDDSEDCKVCVTEGLLLLLHAGYSFARMTVREEEGLLFSLVGEEFSAPISTFSEDEISIALLSALALDVETRSKESVLESIAFRFGRK